MKVFNLFDGELDKRRDQEGFSWTARAVGPAIGGREIGASLYELEPGEKSFPYHYEFGAEEWLIVVTGTPTLREPGGERELRPGDTVAFPEGPEGAHQVLNTGTSLLKYLCFSTMLEPDVAFYPDSEKLSVFQGGAPGTLEAKMTTIPAHAECDYWEGEE